MRVIQPVQCIQPVNRLGAIPPKSKDSGGWTVLTEPADISDLEIFDPVANATRSGAPAWRCYNSSSTSSFTAVYQKSLPVTLVGLEFRFRCYIGNSSTTYNYLNFCLHTSAYSKRFAGTIHYYESGLMRLRNGNNVNIGYRVDMSPDIVTDQLLILRLEDNESGIWFKYMQEDETVLFEGQLDTTISSLSEIPANTFAMYFNTQRYTSIYLYDFMVRGKTA